MVHATTSSSSAHTSQNLQPQLSLINYHHYTSLNETLVTLKALLENAQSSEDLETNALQIKCLAFKAGYFSLEIGNAFLKYARSALMNRPIPLLILKIDITLQCSNVSLFFAKRVIKEVDNVLRILKTQEPIIEDVD